MNVSFNFSLFSCLLSVKDSLLISFPEVFGYMTCESKRQNKYLFISKSGNPIETRLNIIRALNPRQKKTWKFTKSLRENGSEFKISELITSFSTSPPGSLAFVILLMTTRVFFILITIGKVRDPGILSYLIDNFNSKRK